MNDDLRVQGTTLEQAAERLVTTARNLHGDLGDLDSRLGPLKSDWEGAQQQAYRATKEKWDEMMREIITVLEQSSNAVQESGQAYKASDMRGSDRLSM